MNDSNLKRAQALYKLVGVTIPVYHLTRLEIRKVIIRSLKRLTNLTIKSIKNDSGNVNTSRINFEFVLKHEYPLLWKFVSGYKYTTGLNLHKPLSEYAYRNANVYLQSIFPDLNEVLGEATVDKFTNNINNMLSDVNQSSQNRTVNTLLIDLLTETTYVLIHLLWGCNRALSIQPRDLHVIGDSVNRSTNSGFPGDFKTLVKKEAVYDRYSYNLLRLITCSDDNLTAMLNKIYSYPIMIFMRKQFKYSESLKRATVKLRVVLGVSGDEAFADLHLFTLIYDSLKSNFPSPFCTGLLQKEISKKVSDLKNFHVFWFDAKNFDHNTISLTVIILFFVFDLIYSKIKDDRMKTKLRKWNLRSLLSFLTNSYFNPLTKRFHQRSAGIPSGSTWTNLVGTWCSLFSCIYVLIGYFGIKYSDFMLGKIKFLSSGDDIVIAMSDLLYKSFDPERFVKLIQFHFRMVYEYDGSQYSPPGIDVLEFLGSKWINGKPFRKWENLIVQICFFLNSKYKGPLTLRDLLLTRLIEIGGNSANCSELLVAFGFDLNEITGRTVKIKLLVFDESVNTYVYEYVNYVIPDDPNTIWEGR